LFVARADLFAVGAQECLPKQVWRSHGKSKEKNDMRNRALHLLLIAALVMSVLFITSGAPASQASEAPDAQAEPQAASPFSTDKQLPSHLGEVPADLQALFADGMTPEEFVQMAGYVPSAWPTWSRAMR
jgi:hypothetical protein